MTHISGLLEEEYSIGFEIYLPKIPGIYVIFAIYLGHIVEIYITFERISRHIPEIDLVFPTYLPFMSPILFMPFANMLPAGSLFSSHLNRCQIYQNNIGISTSCCQEKTCRREKFMDATCHSSSSYFYRPLLYHTIEHECANGRIGAQRVTRRHFSKPPSPEPDMLLSQHPALQFP